jgi:hypothetical protein
MIVILRKVVFIGHGKGVEVEMVDWNKVLVTVITIIVVVFAIIVLLFFPWGWFL